MRRQSHGYSLYELLLTTALSAALLTMGIPSLAAMTARHQQRAEINALFHAVHVARKESVMRRKVVSLCPSRDGTSCGARDDWSRGWLMFENSDRDSPPQIDGGEAILQRHTVADSVVINANRHGFTLRATVLRATNGTIVVCDSADRIRPKALVVSYTGRPRVATRTPGGKAYRCAD